MIKMHLLDTNTGAVSVETRFLSRFLGADESRFQWTVDDLDPGGERGSVGSAGFREREAAVAGDISEINPMTQIADHAHCVGYLNHINKIFVSDQGCARFSEVWLFSTEKM